MCRSTLDQRTEVRQMPLMRTRLPDPVPEYVYELACGHRFHSPAPVEPDAAGMHEFVCPQCHSVDRRPVTAVTWVEDRKAVAKQDRALCQRRALKYWTDRSPEEVVRHAELADCLRSDVDEPPAVTAAVNMVEQLATDMGVSFTRRPPAPERVTGEQNGRAKLSDCDVVAIRRASVSGAALARQYNVDRGTISKILSCARRSMAVCPSLGVDVPMCA